MVRLDFPHNFPAIPSNQPVGFEWMIPDQNFAYVYGFTCIGILAFVLLILLNKLRKKVMAFFVSPFQVSCVVPGQLFTTYHLPFLHDRRVFGILRSITSRFLCSSSAVYPIQRRTYRKLEFPSIHFRSYFAMLKG